MDFGHTMPFTAAVYIRAAYKIPALMCEGQTQITLGKQGFSMNAEQLILGIARTNYTLAWSWDLSHFLVAGSVTVKGADGIAEKLASNVMFLIGKAIKLVIGAADFIANKIPAAKAALQNKMQDAKKICDKFPSFIGDGCRAALDGAMHIARTAMTVAQKALDGVLKTIKALAHKTVKAGTGIEMKTLQDADPGDNVAKAAPMPTPGPTPVPPTLSPTPAPTTAPYICRKQTVPSNEGAGLQTEPKEAATKINEKNREIHVKAATQKQAAAVAAAKAAAAKAQEAIANSVAKASKAVSRAVKGIRRRKIFGRRLLAKRKKALSEDTQWDEASPKLLETEAPAGTYSRDQCQALCDANAGCNGFAWPRNGADCYLKKGFDSKSVQWRNDAGSKNYDFCYQISYAEAEAAREIKEKALAKEKGVKVATAKESATKNAAKAREFATKAVAKAQEGATKAAEKTQKNVASAASAAKKAASAAAEKIQKRMKNVLGRRRKKRIFGRRLLAKTKQGSNPIQAQDETSNELAEAGVSDCACKSFK